MSEFKGTKGEWQIKGYTTPSGQSYYIEKPNGSEICHTPIRTGKENKANAQLISKAPEMLQMLNNIHGELLRCDFVLDERWVDKIEKLIKEATKL